MKKKASERRDFIQKRLLEDPKTPLTEVDLIPEFGETPSITTLRNYALDLQAAGIPIKFTTKSEDHDFEFRYEKEFLTTVGKRAARISIEKSEISRIATQLIAPTEEQKRKWLDGPMPDMLKAKFESLWKKRNRLIVLDAGSTVGRIAEELMSIKTPDEERHLFELRILTNSYLVYQKLHQKPSTHRIILLGGVERYDTGAIGGTLAQQCMDAWGLKPDLAVLGATNLNDDGNWCCDHEDEAAIKERFLDSHIRCIAVDSTKLVRTEAGSKMNHRGIGSAFPFATMSNFMLDLVISDTRLQNRAENFIKDATRKNVFVACEPPA